MFCGDTEITEEHVIADWVHRAFACSRHPGRSFSGTFIGHSEMRMHREPPIEVARVTCRTCNNVWISQLDGATSEILKPLIRGENAVTLDRAGQTVFAAWLLKTALVFDAMENGDRGRLAPQRKPFFDRLKAPDALVVFAGPAPDIPFTVSGVPEAAGLRLFGIRQLDGVMNLAINAQDPKTGAVTRGTPTQIPIPGYHVMLGGLFAYLSSRIPIFNVTPDYVQVWPIISDEVAVQVAPV
jgi:hypothetical protein